MLDKSCFTLLLPFASATNIVTALPYIIVGILIKVIACIHIAYKASVLTPSLAIKASKTTIKMTPSKISCPTKGSAFCKISRIAITRLVNALASVRRKIKPYVKTEMVTVQVDAKLAPIIPHDKYWTKN